MRKWLAIFGLLVLVNGAWSQVPGNGSGQHDKAQDKQETANPPKPVIAVDSQHGANSQDHAYEKPSDYPWKELLAPTNVPNWALVLVGGITGWFVYKTLKAIKKQADIMERQAKDAQESGAQTFAILKEQTDNLLISAKAATVSAFAADKSATAAMGLAIPILMLSEFEFAARPEKTIAEILRHPPMRITVKNYGQSPAILKFVAVKYILGKPPAEADYDPPSPFDVGTVVESAKTLTLSEIDTCMWGMFSEDDVRAIKAGEKYMTIYGTIWYGDVFGPTIHKLSFSKGLGGFNGEDGMYWADTAIPDSAGYDPD
jgi:hypothetical protein